MIIYPAIDLRGGRCVRLRQGDAAAETVFADDPVEAARRWISEGAQWLHVVNLDGALGQSGTANLEALKRILAAVDVPVQFGGGLRSVEDVDRLLKLGVARVILGTVAVRQPQIVEEALQQFGAAKIVVGIDARDGYVAIHGWQNMSNVEATVLARQMRSLGIEWIVYTDIQRDGMLTGVNVEATVQLAHAFGGQVIASGGVTSLEDILALLTHQAEGIAGVIVGMALYRGVVRLPDALQLVRGG